jgi:hypothetical protein
MSAATPAVQIADFRARDIRFVEHNQIQFVHNPEPEQTPKVKLSSLLDWQKPLAWSRHSS